jgi:hypothetical protein
MYYAKRIGGGDISWDANLKFESLNFQQKFKFYVKFLFHLTLNSYLFQQLTC